MAVGYSRRAVLGAAAALVSLPRLGAAGPGPRVVTVGAPVTETVFALGAGGAVVATDSTSRYPAAAAALPKLGYMRALSAEGLLSLAPSRVIAQDGAGPPEVLDRLRDAGVAVDEVPERPDLDGLAAKVAHIAEALDRAEQGRVLVDRLRHRLAAVAQPAKPLSVLCLIHPGASGWMAAGDKCVPDLMIRLAGGRNAVAFEGIKPLSLEAAVAGQPDVLAVGSSALAQAGGLDALLAQPHLAATPAAWARRVAVLDSPVLLGLGPRLPEAVEALAQAMVQA